MASHRIKMCPSNIAILGTGDFGRALAKRLLASGISVTMGSRYPDKRRQLARDDILTKVTLVSLQECVRSSDVVVVAVHPEHYSNLLPLAPLLAGKILVDVSNSTSASDKSNAEILQDLFPASFVVKSLNTVSAHALESMAYSQRPVGVCGDDPEARLVVIQLVHRLGYVGVDGGPLDGARRLEQVNRAMFPGWGWGTWISLLVAGIWTIYGSVRYFAIVDPPLPWYRLFSNVLGKIFACTAITLLALSFIPGPIAALKQLTTGTKHRRFPKPLSTFLLMRKQLGLYALLFGILHAVLSIALMNSAYYGSWFEAKAVVIRPNGTADVEIPVDFQMSWKGEICQILGLLAAAGLVILGITSINSISDSFNWREWQCVHSHFGFVVLLLAVAHVTVHAAPGWKTDPFSEVVTKLSFLSLPLPMFALLLKIIILLPCVYIPVQRIRNGWERSDKRGSPTCPPAASFGGSGDVNDEDACTNVDQMRRQLAENGCRNYAVDVMEL